MPIEQDDYNVLGISMNANAEETKQAYRKIAFQYHPDRNQNYPETNKKMQAINEAYSTLADSKRRQVYDLPLGSNTITPKFAPGSMFKVNYHSNSPYKDHVGMVDKEPLKDYFRFQYMVRFEMNGYSTIILFAEEELSTFEKWYS